MMFFESIISITTLFSIFFTIGGKRNICASYSTNITIKYHYIGKMYLLQYKMPMIWWEHIGVLLSKLLYIFFYYRVIISSSVFIIIIIVALFHLLLLFFLWSSPV